MSFIGGSCHEENPAGTFRLDWTSDQISRTFTVGVFQTLGLRVDNNPAKAGVRTENGQKVVYGTALAFDVDDDFAFDLDNKVKVKMVIDAGSLDSIVIAYDKNGVLSSVQKVPVNRKLNGYRTIEFELERARFANRGFGGTDFMVAAGQDMSSDLVAIKSIWFEIEQVAESQVIPVDFELKLSNASGESLAALVGLYDVSGRAPLPSNDAIEIQIFENMTRSIEVREELDQLNWPHGNHFAMLVDGNYKSKVPPGNYTLVLTKGPEYPIIKKQIQIDEQEGLVELILNKTYDMPAQGWYSGDVHNHFTRIDAKTNENHMVHARAADLHMHWMYALGNSVTTYFPQYAWGEEGEYRERDYYLASGQEDPRTDFLGHVLAMGHDEFVRYPKDYFHYDKVSKEVHNQGGVFGIAHMDFAQFQQKVALALLAPENEVDFVEIFQYSALHLEDWYAFLNLGFRLPAAAGSDWPYMSLPGSVRTYAKIKGKFTPTSWNKALKRGHTFVSNGPLIDMSIGTHGIGDEVVHNKKKELIVRASAKVDSTWDYLSKGYLIVNGETVKEWSWEDPITEVEMSFPLKLEKSAWVALRVEGKKSQDIVFQTPYTKKIQAHSSPIYVVVNDQPTWDVEKAPVIIDRLIERLESVKTMEYQWNDNEAWESPEKTKELLESFRSVLQDWLSEAQTYYSQRKTEVLKK